MLLNVRTFQLTFSSCRDDHYSLCAGKADDLTRENAKILQKIVEARQINVKVKSQNLDSIRKEEQRARSTRDANMRAGLRRQSDIAMNNQKLAIKLFTQ